MSATKHAILRVTTLTNEIGGGHIGNSNLVVAFIGPLVGQGLQSEGRRSCPVRGLSYYVSPSNVGLAYVRTCCLTILNGRHTPSFSVVWQSSANRLNLAPGNQAGRYFT